MSRALLILLLAVSLLPAPAAARQTPPAGAAPDRRGPDVVVTAPAEGPNPVTLQGPPQNADRDVYARQAAADARLFSRCLKSSDDRWLRDVVDTPPNSGARVVGIDQIVRNHQACYPGIGTLGEATINFYGNCDFRGHKEIYRDGLTGRFVVRATSGICQSFYTRGALVEQALRRYAPGLSFTSAELFAPAVIARFLARERRFDGSRSKQERIFAQVAACVVAVHPPEALALFGSAPNSREEARARGALIGTSPGCVGGASHVAVDPADFRVFVADAIYGWAVALRGADSLVPAG